MLNGIEFNILYSGGHVDDARTLCEYIDGFYDSLGIRTCDLDLGKLLAVVQATYQDFPHPVGAEKSSPFKKVAAFTANFAAERPIVTPLPSSFGPLASHQNAVLAVTLSIDALEGAVIKCKRRGDITLSNRICLSKHFWKDLVAAASSAVPLHHFECLALIYEALAYQFNPGASYDRVV